jgi:DNA-binding GntR family transcriptional regulator
LSRSKHEIDFDPPAPGAEESAYLYIRDQILNGAFQPGNRLPEETVAQQIGLSRTPVRGALHRLATEGFVEFRRYVGAIVRVLPADEIDQLFQVRVVMESLAAELAAQNATVTMIDELESLCVEMDAVATREVPDLMHIARLNKQFHFKLLMACGNLHVRRIAENLGDLNVMVRSYALYSRAVLMRSMGHHRELVQALRARNPQWARSVMTAHIEAARSASRGAREVPQVAEPLLSSEAVR